MSDKIKEQEKCINLYKMLKSKHKNELFNKVMDKELYMGEGQEGLTKWYKILEPKHQEVFVGRLENAEVIELYRELYRQNQGKHIDIYNMLSNDQKREFVGKILENVEDGEFMGLYRGLYRQNQGKHIDIYNMLSNDQKREFVGKILENVEDGEFMGLYRGLYRQNQGKHIDIYNMLNNDQKKKLIGNSRNEDVKRLAASIGPGEPIELYTMLVDKPVLKEVVKKLGFADVGRLIRKVHQELGKNSPDQEPLKKLLKILYGHQKNLQEASWKPAEDKARAKR